MSTIIYVNAHVIVFVLLSAYNNADMLMLAKGDNLNPPVSMSPRLQRRETKKRENGRLGLNSSTKLSKYFKVIFDDVFTDRLIMQRAVYIFISTSVI